MRRGQARVSVPFGWPRAFVRDPDGNNVEAASTAPSPRPRRHQLRVASPHGRLGCKPPPAELLRDAFTPPHRRTSTTLTDDLTEEVSLFRPTPTANSIDWLIWHSARIQDAQVAHIAGTEQVWFRRLAG